MNDLHVTIIYVYADFALFYGFYLYMHVRSTHRRGPYYNKVVKCLLICLLYVYVRIYMHM